jgi:hypothetical protein
LHSLALLPPPPPLTIDDSTIATPKLWQMIQAQGYFSRNGTALGVAQSKNSFLITARHG